MLLMLILTGLFLVFMPHDYAITIHCVSVFHIYMIMNTVAKILMKLDVT